MSDAELKVDDYQLTSSIATGNSSQVWEVRDGGGQSYAMKLLLSDAFTNPEQVAVLKHESKVGQSLEHPTFIRILKFVKSKTHCYMLMELFKCPNLKAMLQNEPIAVQSRFGRLAEQLAIALGHMHDKGWLHHDLKPDNILFSKSSELKIIDFSLSMRRKGGLGKMVGGKVKVVQGTRTYIAPETIKKEYPTPQSDMYSLGVTLFEVLTGQPPFVGNTPNDLLVKHLGAKPPEPSFFNPNVTPEADKFILRLLSKKPAHRPKDMAEIGAELRSLKVFKRDPVELAGEAEEARKAAGLGLDAKSRLDSRADAGRTAAGISAPPKSTARKPTAAALAEAKRHGQAQPAAQQEAAGQPGYPGYAPPPDWAAAGYGYQAYPQGYWPQYPPAQGQGPQPQPYYPYPQQPAPQQTAGPAPHPHANPPGAPAQWQEGPAPGQAPPAAGERPAPPPTTESKSLQYLLPGQGRPADDRHPTQRDVDPDEIPLMEELPDVL